MKLRFNIIVLLFLVLFPKQSFLECTSFCFETNDTILFGNNLDAYISDGLVVVNKRNVFKIAIWQSNPVNWTSKYGSLTFNQWGREFPSRGINEAGLAVGEMTHVTPILIHVHQFSICNGYNINWIIVQRLKKL
jgi:penicillin V acylase-like amidase (Ntn superfamily)